MDVNVEKKMGTIKKALKKYDIKNLDEAKSICDSKGIDVESIVKGVQPICFDDAVWAYTLGCAIAIKNNAKKAEENAKACNHLSRTSGGYMGTYRIHLFPLVGRGTDERCTLSHYRI